MNHKRSSHFDLQSMFDIVSINKILVAVCVAAAMVFGIFFQYKITVSFVKVQAVIGFNFSGIEKGQDPAGGKFDVTTLKSPNLVLKALEQTGLSKTVNDASVANAITITPIVPNNVIEQLNQRLLETKNGIKSSETYEYYPSQYNITLSMNKQWNMSREQGRQFVTSLIEQYASSFYNTYGTQLYVPNSISNLDIKGYDYPDLGTYFKTQIGYLTSFAQTKSKANSSFRSTATGLSFDDIYNSVTSMKKIQFDQLTALVDSYALTNDKENRIKIYESQINDLTITVNQYLDEKQVASEALSKMEQGKQQYFYTSSDTSTSNTGNANITSNPQYTGLIERYMNAGVAASTAGNEITDLKRKIKYLQDDHYTTAQKEEAKQKADALIGAIVTDLNHWVDLTNRTAADYYKADPLNLAVRTVAPAVNASNFSKKAFVKTAAMFAVMGFFVGFLLAAAFYYSKKRKKNQFANLVEKDLYIGVKNENQENKVVNA